MNWNTIAAIAELAGAVGVILSLLYVALQVRQNTRAQRLHAIQVASDNSARLGELLAKDAELSELFWQGLRHPEALDLASRRRFLSLLNAFFRREAAAFYLHQEAVMSEEIWQARVEALRTTLNQPGTHLFLEAAGATLPRQFREFMLEVVAQESSLSERAESILFGG